MRVEYPSGRMFAAGALIPLMVMLVGFPIVGAMGLWVGQSLLVPVSLLGVACVVGGVMAGGGVSGGRWSRARFGTSFPVGLGGPLLTVANLGGLAGQESFVGLCLTFAPLFAVSNVLLGAGGLGLTGRGWRGELGTLCLFGIGGGCGGALLASTTWVAGFCPPAVAAGVLFVGASLAIGGSAGIGGWALDVSSVR